MADSVDLKITGDPEKWNEIGNLQAVVTRAVQVTSQAKLFAPVDLGRLRGSIMWRVAGDREEKEGGHGDGGSSTGEKIQPPEGGKAGQVVGVVGTAVDYGIYQEFGTRKMPPQPYLRPAVLKIEGKSLREIRDIMVKTMDDGIKRDPDRVIRF